LFTGRSQSDSGPLIDRGASFSFANRLIIIWKGKERTLPITSHNIEFGDNSSGEDGTLNVGHPECNVGHSSDWPATDEGGRGGAEAPLNIGMYNFPCRRCNTRVNKGTYIYNSIYIHRELENVLRERGVPAPALTAVRLLQENGLEEAAQSLHLVLGWCMEEARHRCRMAEDHQELWNGLNGGRSSGQETGGRHAAAADAGACSRVPAPSPSLGIHAKRLRVRQATPTLSEPHMRFGVAAKEVGVGRRRRLIVPRNDHGLTLNDHGCGSSKRDVEALNGPLSQLEAPASHNIDYVPKTPALPILCEHRPPPIPAMVYPSDPRGPFGIEESDGGL